MFFNRKKIQVVKPRDCTDYSDRFAELESIKAEHKQFATKKTVAIAATVPATVSIGLTAYSLFTTNHASSNTLYETTTSTEPLNVITNPFIEPSTFAEVYTPLAVNTVPTNLTPIPQQTGLIADASLEMLATVLDPVIQILVAISFPIASVIMVSACFFFMLGKSEKAWSMIMNAGLGYVLVQLSPLFLEILRQVGEAV